MTSTDEIMARLTVNEVMVEAVVTLGIALLPQAASVRFKSDLNQLMALTYNRLLNGDIETVARGAATADATKLVFDRFMEKLNEREAVVRKALGTR